MRKRKALSKRTRFEVFKRDRFTCQYCGRTPPAVILHVDHIIAVANDGDGTMDNLITSCADCNLGKSDRPIDSAVPPLRESMARAAELAEQTDAYNRFLLEQRQRSTDAIERLGIYWFNQFYEEKNKYVFGSDRQKSIRTFLKHLPEVELLEAIDTAHSRMPPRYDRDEKTFKYFCGICWNTIKGKDQQ